MEKNNVSFENAMKSLGFGSIIDDNVEEDNNIRNLMNEVNKIIGKGQNFSNYKFTLEELKNYLKVRATVSYYALEKCEKLLNNLELFEAISNLYTIILLQSEQLKILKWPVSEIKKYINGREKEVIEEYLYNNVLSKGMSTETAEFHAKEKCESLKLTEVINVVVDKVTEEDKKIKKTIK